MSLPLDVLTHLPVRNVTEVKQLVHDVEVADGKPPLSDHVLLHLAAGDDHGVRHLLVRSGEQLVGYGHLDIADPVTGSSGELAVHPSFRKQGIGRQLVQGLLDTSPDGRLRLWARAGNPGAVALASAFGFARTRVLWQMRRPLSLDLPAVLLPEGVEVRTFVVGQDEQAWTALNNIAFAGHPDQSGWTLDQVLLREHESWFDPAGFFLAFRGDRLVGFHWTKVHGGEEHEALGEVYVVGVDPAEQGAGLGRALTLLGLHHLRDQGLGEVLLYVDESNTAAVRVYEKLGFTCHSEDVSYSR